MDKPTITHADLLTRLRYDPITGDFTWLIEPCRSKKLIGKKAGHYGRYIEIRLGNRSYLAHRLAHFYMTGVWPSDQIDHINCDRHDNRWANLRCVTATQNMANVGPLKTSKSGLKGVRFDPGRRKWRAQIWNAGKVIHLGMHPSKESAYASYCAKAKELHGEYARL